MRFFVLSMAFAVMLACSGDETDTGASTATTTATSGSGAASQGGAGPGGAAAGGRGGGSGGTFSCRDMLDCQKGVEYCQIMHPGANGADPVYSCEPLPKECEPLIECKCLGLMGPRCICQQSAEGDLQVTCMGI